MGSGRSARFRRFEGSAEILEFARVHSRAQGWEDLRFLFLDVHARQRDQLGHEVAPARIIGGHHVDFVEGGGHFTVLVEVVVSKIGTDSSIRKTPVSRSTSSQHRPDAHRDAMSAGRRQLPDSWRPPAPLVGEAA